MAGPGAEYQLTGHKWFCSAPMSDIFLVLAQAESTDGSAEGLSCFLMPRILPDGTRNAMHIQRLKDKLGNRSNASSEIELHNAWAQMVGEPGRGVPTIIEMVGHTRLDCVIGAAAGMRAAVVQATHHTAHRAAFGQTLIDQPLMRNVLADLCLESEAATALAMRLARAYDEAGNDAREGNDDSDAQLFKRVATAVGKYWACKRAPNHAFEAMECLGGNGYVEDSGMPRLYREAPLTSIWEGSGNVISLDVLRALSRSPRSLEVFLAEVELAQGADARLDAHVQRLKSQFTDPATLESRARRVVEGMALALEGSLLVRDAPPAVADAFCASRLGGDGGLEYGTLPAGSDFETIIEREPVRSYSSRGPAQAAPTIQIWECAPISRLRSHLRHPRRRGDQLVRGAVLLHLRRHALLPRSARAARSTTAYLVAVASVLSFFASLILHELGHALVARRNGLRVVGIDLWAFGGITRTSGIVEGPGTEFRVAAAGPLVTLGVIVVCILAGRASDQQRALLRGGRR